MQLTIAVTGATGFVGSHLVRHLATAGFCVKALCRDVPQQTLTTDRIEWLRVPQLNDMAATMLALRGTQVVVHLAARAHVLNETSVDPKAEFLRNNRDVTLSLAKSAALAGVRRFVYVSSIGVNGNVTHGTPFTESSPFNPVTAYALSKQEAELGLKVYAGTAGLEVVVIRPPLIYGPGVRGNVLRLLKIVHSKVLLPFGSVDNRRSLVGVHNLTDFIIQASIQKKARDRVLIVTDGCSISTPELISTIAELMGKRVRLLRVPVGIMRVAATLSGKIPLYQQLYESLEVDDTMSRDILGWEPPVPCRAGLAEMVTWFSGVTGVSRVDS